MKRYKSQIQKLNESRKAYKSLLSERENIPYPDGDSIAPPPDGDMSKGFPGKCCDGQGNVVNVTFASAADDCDDLGMYEVAPNGKCQLTIDPHPIDLDLDPIDNDGGTMVVCLKCVNGQSVGNQFPGSCPTGWVPQSSGIDPCDDEIGPGKMISCDFCDNGSPVSQMFPGPNCPPNTIPSGTGDPCEQTSSPCGPNSFNVTGTCAGNANMVQNWAGPAGPGNFLQNMDNGFQQFGCQFLQNRLINHQTQMTNMVFTGPNNPQGYANPGPLWVAQKQSKIDWLQCIITSCCTGGNTPTNPQVMSKVRPTGERGRTNKR